MRDALDELLRQVRANPADPELRLRAMHVARRLGAGGDGVGSVLEELTAPVRAAFLAASKWSELGRRTCTVPPWRIEEDADAGALLTSLELLETTAEFLLAGDPDVAEATLALGLTELAASHAFTAPSPAAAPPALYVALHESLPLKRDDRMLGALLRRGDTGLQRKAKSWCSRSHLPSASLEAALVDEEFARRAYIPGPDAPPMERQPSRGFGAHGGDWDMGHFLGLRTRLDVRLRILTLDTLSRLCRVVADLMTELDLPPVETIAFGSGYGFVWPRGVAPTPEAIADFCEIVNSWTMLPGELFYDGNRPFDHLPDNETLIRRFERDIMHHPGRFPTRADSTPLGSSPLLDYLQKVGPGRRAPPTDCEAELERAIADAAEPGQEALRRFHNSLGSRGRPTLPFLEE